MTTSQGFETSARPPFGDVFGDDETLFDMLTKGSNEDEKDLMDLSIGSEMDLGGLLDVSSFCGDDEFSSYSFDFSDLPTEAVLPKEPSMKTDNPPTRMESFSSDENNICAGPFQEHLFLSHRQEKPPKEFEQQSALDVTGATPLEKPTSTLPEFVLPPYEAGDTVAGEQITGNGDLLLPPPSTCPRAQGTNYSFFKRDAPDLGAILPKLMKHCESHQFEAFCIGAGLSNASSQQNGIASEVMSSRFSHAFQQCPEQACLAVVFHGTAERNIPSILENGLDPKLRKGQAFGPGEYFGKSPSVSVGYCKGGFAMLAFLVVLPSSAQGRGSSQVVVVENNDHQFPIGVVSFGSVEQKVMTKSQQMRKQLEMLNREARVKAKEAVENRNKADIIQLIVQDRWDTAVYKWEGAKHTLSDFARREISMYAHNKLRAYKLANGVFPGLPAPITSLEWFKQPMAFRSVEATERKAMAAARAVEQQKQAIQTEEAIIRQRHMRERRQRYFGLQHNPGALPLQELRKKGEQAFQEQEAENIQQQSERLRELRLKRFLKKTDV